MGHPILLIPRKILSTMDRMWLIRIIAMILWKMRGTTITFNPRAPPFFRERHEGLPERTRSRELSLEETPAATLLSTQRTEMVETPWMG